MHLGIWGQNQFFWFLAMIFDNELTRMLYFQSSYATALVPYVGVPAYMLYTVGFWLGDFGDEYGFRYTIFTLMGWTAYSILMQEYSHNILTSLYNYWMLEVAKNID